MRGVRGLVGQGMSGRKVAHAGLAAVSSNLANGSGSFTATTSCTVFLYGYGAGGSGAVASASFASGGGGGGAGYKHISLIPGQRISWVIGAGGVEQNTDPGDGSDGGDTTVTLPDGTTLVAGGGKKGVASGGGGPGGLGGVCLGSWDLARTGGRGGTSGSSLGTAGESPVGGGTGGAASVNNGGGGGSAGFTDRTPGLPVGTGQAAQTGSDTSTAPGGATGGSAAAGTSFAGRDGGVVIYAVRVSV